MLLLLLLFVDRGEHALLPPLPLTLVGRHTAKRHVDERGRAPHLPIPQLYPFLLLLRDAHYLMCARVTSAGSLFCAACGCVFILFFLDTTLSVRPNKRSKHLLAEDQDAHRLCVAVHGSTAAVLLFSQSLIEDGPHARPLIMVESSCLENFKSLPAMPPFPSLLCQPGKSDLDQVMGKS